MRPASPAGLRALARQVSAFFGVGIAAAIVHYGLLVSLVEGYRVEPVRATLVGYVGGGIVSYLLNRRHTYASARPHREAGWRFAAVALVGFGLTWLVMALFVRGMGLPYLPAQIVTTAIVLFWSFMAHKLWTFREPPALVP
jgi:putative flippase GtrA